MNKGYAMALRIFEDWGDEWACVNLDDIDIPFDEEIYLNLWEQWGKD